MYTHQIDFFSNVVKVVIEHGVIVKTDDDSGCPDCGEAIAGYWLLNGKHAMCPTFECDGGNWPIVKLAT